jgi:hypothetical protein
MQDGEPMQDPVMAADGHTYERRGIAEWLANSTTSPVTNAMLRNQVLAPNHSVTSTEKALEGAKETAESLKAQLKAEEQKMTELTSALEGCKDKPKELQKISTGARGS